MFSLECNNLSIGSLCITSIDNAYVQTTAINDYNYELNTKQSVFTKIRFCICPTLVNFKTNFLYIKYHVGSHIFRTVKDLYPLATNTWLLHWCYYVACFTNIFIDHNKHTVLNYSFSYFTKNGWTTTNHDIFQPYNTAEITEPSREEGAEIQVWHKLLKLVLRE